MLDMHRLLTHVMGGAPTQGDANQPLQSTERLPPSFGGHPISGLRLPGQGQGIGYAGALGTGALAGGLVGLLFGSKNMRKLAGKAAQIGAVAAIGGLAYKAYENYRQGKPVVPQSLIDLLGGPLGNGGAPVQEAAIPLEYRSPEAARLLLRTMVAAAATDGHLDQMEYGRIRQQLLSSGLNEEEQFFLSQLIMHPSSIPELAAAATTPELRSEVYAAAKLAIDLDSPVEREWLDQLATALELAPELRAHLDAIQTEQRLHAA